MNKISAPKAQKGWLSRWTRKQWSRHWFVLKNGSLTYYRGPAAELCSFLDGVLDLSLIKHIEVSPITSGNEKQHTQQVQHHSIGQQQQQQQQTGAHFAFTLKMWNGECHLLAASSAQERTLWLDAINECTNVDVDDEAGTDSASSSDSSPTSNLSARSTDIGLASLRHYHHQLAASQQAISSSKHEQLSLDQLAFNIKSAAIKRRENQELKLVELSATAESASLRLKSLSQQQSKVDVVVERHHPLTERENSRRKEASVPVSEGQKFQTSENSPINKQFEQAQYQHHHHRHSHNHHHIHQASQHLTRTTSSNDNTSSACEEPKKQQQVQLMNSNSLSFCDQSQAFKRRLVCLHHENTEDEEQAKELDSVSGVEPKLIARCRTTTPTPPTKCQSDDLLSQVTTTSQPKQPPQNKLIPSISSTNSSLVQKSEQLTSITTNHPPTSPLVESSDESELSDRSSASSEESDEQSDHSEDEDDNDNEAKDDEDEDDNHDTDDTSDLKLKLRDKTDQLKGEAVEAEPRKESPDMSSMKQVVGVHKKRVTFDLSLSSLHQLTSSSSDSSSDSDSSLSSASSSEDDEPVGMTVSPESSKCDSIQQPMTDLPQPASQEQASSLKQLDDSKTAIYRTLSELKSDTTELKEQLVLELQRKLEAAQSSISLLERQLNNSYDNYNKLELSYERLQLEMSSSAEAHKSELERVQLRVDELNRELMGAHEKLLKYEAQLTESNNNKREHQQNKQHKSPYQWWNIHQGKSAQQVALQHQHQHQHHHHHHQPLLLMHHVKHTLALNQQLLGAKLLTHSRQIQRKLNELELKVDKISDHKPTEAVGVTAQNSAQNSTILSSQLKVGS